MPCVSFPFRMGKRFDIELLEYFLHCLVSGLESRVLRWGFRHQLSLLYEAQYILETLVLDLVVRSRMSFVVVVMLFCLEQVAIVVAKGV